MCDVIRVAIVEDEREVREQLAEYLRRYERQFGRMFEVSLFEDGDEIVSDYRAVYDIILLDVQMRRMDGMAAAEAIRKVDKDVLLIFITNMAQFAIKGYAVDALDYVLKPVSYYSFEMKMKKVRRILAERQGNSVVLSSKGELRRIPVRSILYVEVRDHSLYYYTGEGEFSATGSMKKLEQELEPQGFARCNNCYLVNLMHVRAVSQEQVVVGETELKISRPRRKAFMQALSAYYGGGGE